jgi:penicillin-binding protein 1C
VGNFSGRAMEGVSGITGAGPLLHRSVLEVARRYAPGHLVRPEEAGLVASKVCILSGMRSTPSCPAMLEWFAPGTEPLAFDDWQVDGRTMLPPEYAEWAAQSSRSNIVFATNPSEQAEESSAKRILSPLDGDRYERPVGVEARYATIPLIAGSAEKRVRWQVDGRPHRSPRWQLAEGDHLITAVWPDGARDSVRVTVR